MSGKQWQVEHPSSLLAKTPSLPFLLPEFLVLVSVAPIAPTIETCVYASHPPSQKNERKCPKIRRKVCHS
ncbi:hypothetical protein DUNSADRAFT_18047 [Dunaliella salina]|uniref:Encoded protein n=1 Tax=Dunaliella salina TaxID=3046 RepID=A0ABQ7GZH7_DUNSA|nr:hypothetical protein DUNSADRAFT_18047 [Dunaliella salina]|eukprot:KAF5840010.1 hypothetical protein DUNSADRAFT_18047 [Dunaliella salina]